MAAGTPSMGALYVMPFPGLVLWGRRRWALMPADIAGCDCVLIQAFGRGSYPDRELTATLAGLFPDGVPALPTAMWVLRRAGFEAGEANRHLTMIVYGRYLAANRNLIVIAQWEVCYSLWRLDPEYFGRLVQAGQLVCLWPEGDYYATWHVKQASVRIMAERKLQRPIELAHHAMLIRAVMILWQLGVNPRWEPLWLPYEPASVQWWTRNWFVWMIREVPGRLIHIWKRWVAWRPPRSPAPLD